MKTSIHQLLCSSVLAMASQDSKLTVNFGKESLKRLHAVSIIMNINRISVPVKNLIKKRDVEQFAVPEKGVPFARIQSHRA